VLYPFPLHFIHQLSRLCSNYRTKFFAHKFFNSLSFLFLLPLYCFFPPRSANANEIGDIEFTVCELNCSNDQASPVHERKPRFSSFKKSGALSKAVRSKLNLSKSSTQSTEKPSDSSSFDHENKQESASAENGSSGKASDEQSSGGGSNKSHPTKVTKKKSKLCLLL
jgi:hypothetical protein